MRTLGEIQPGMTVGRYEFLVPIAQGGMAAVWAARLKGSRGFSKTVAVKTMLPTISDEPQFEQMFLDEAQIAAGIRHPNVAEIMDLGEQDDVLYLVMEWVDGEPLSALRRAAAKASGVPRPVAVKIIADACAGLHAAHELKDNDGKLLGVVHRDISPQNMLVTYDGVVKIVDFGVAKAAGRTAVDTQSGQIKGKPPYMSPEQALGEPIDRRTDLFALGIVLYQLTTGKHPFRGESDMVTLQNIVSDRPIVPPRAYDHEYPRALEAVVMKALDRDASKRFQTAAELEAALDRVFPPTVPRVRTEDVGKFVTSLLGPRGEERRNALRDAIRLADERAARGEEIGPLGMRPLADVGRSSIISGSGLMPPLNSSHVNTAVTAPQGLTRPSGGYDGFRQDSAISSSNIGIAPTPYGTQTPTAPPRAEQKSSVMPVLLGVGAAFVLAAIAGTVIMMRSKGDAAPAPAVAPTASVVESVAAAPSAAPTSSTLNANDLAVESRKPATNDERRERDRDRDKKADPGAPAAPPASAAPAADRDDPLAAGKSAPAKKPKPVKRQTGFVPPPVTDPGF